MRITSNAKSFLLPCNSERIKLIGIVDGHNIHRVAHNCHKDKHWKYSITLRDVKAEINGRFAYIKKYMNIEYNFNTSKFAQTKKDQFIEFYVRVYIVNDELHIERPSKIKVIQ